MIPVAFLLGFMIRGCFQSTSQKQQTLVEAESSKTQWWTCSMHPQIRLPHPGKCPICFMDLIPLESDRDEALGPRELKLSEAAAKLAEITTETIHRGKTEIEVRLSGKIKEDERSVKTITAWVPGRLEKLFVDFTGTAVKKGDPLVEIYSAALYVAQEELLQTLENDSADPVLVEAVREKLRQLGLTEKQIKEVETRGTAKDRLIIVSPISGVVIHKNAVEGRYVDKGSQIYTIADLSHVWAVLDAYEKDIGFLSEGQQAVFEAEAIPGDKFQSKINFIDPVVDDKTRSVHVRLDVANTRGVLKPGMFIRATVDAGIPYSGEEPILVPASAVLKTGKRAIVYVRKPDTEVPVYEGREVELGLRAGDYYVALSGLSVGEEVVVKGNFKIDSALQIQAKPSMMNPEIGMVMTGHPHHGSVSKQSHAATKTSNDREMTEMVSESMKISTDFRISLQSFYDSYFKAEEALSKDQFESARTALIELNAETAGIKAPEGRAGHVWQNIQKEILALTEHARHWPDIEVVRSAFDKISQQIILAEKEFGHIEKQDVYRAYCPMAFNQKGTEWLQTDSTISNPYFGSKMLRCGEIKETYKTKN